MEIGGAAMQRMAAAGGPGPLSLQGPPRSVKISPVNIQDEPGDLTSQSTYSYFLNRYRLVYLLLISKSDTLWFHQCDIFRLSLHRIVKRSFSNLQR